MTRPVADKTEADTGKSGFRGFPAVWAIDPGSNSAGVAIYVGSDMVTSWTHRLEKQSKRAGTAVIEVPQNGTHRSRGGVMFAAGRLYQSLCQKYGSFPYVQFVTPSEWRVLVYGEEPPEGKAKEFALRKAKELGVDVASHDEAEAVLIGSVVGLLDRGTKYAKNTRRKRGRNSRNKRYPRILLDVMSRCEAEEAAALIGVSRDEIEEAEAALTGSDSGTKIPRRRRRGNSGNKRYTRKNS